MTERSRDIRTGYLPALIKEARKAARKRPGEMHHVTVAHDDWCNLLAGTGPCNCNPEVGTAIVHSDWVRRN